LSELIDSSETDKAPTYDLDQRDSETLEAKTLEAQALDDEPDA